MIITGRGSTSLYLILKSLPFDSIIVPANVCEVVVAIIKHCGYKITYADIDITTGNSDLKEIESAYSGIEKVVLAVPNFGLAIDMPSIANWCRRKNLFLIEDLCNSYKINWNNIPLGTLGDACIYSFGYAKPIELNNGGGLILKDSNLLKTVRELLLEIPVFNESLLKKQQALNDRLKEFRSNGKLDYRLGILYSEFIQTLIYRLSETEISRIRQSINLHNWDQNYSLRLSNSVAFNKLLEKDFIVISNALNDLPIWRFTFLCKNNQKRNKTLDSIRSEGFIASSWYPNVIPFFEEKMPIYNCPNADDFGDRVINLFIDQRCETEKIKPLADLIIEVNDRS